MSWSTKIGISIKTLNYLDGIETQKAPVEALNERMGNGKWKGLIVKDSSG